jgi:hypothetical protein
MRNSKWAALTTAVAALAPGVQAQAAGTVGQTAPSAAAVVPCTVATYFIAHSDRPGYAIPAGGGVITSWSVQGQANGEGTFKFKVFRQLTPNSFRVEAEDPQTRTVQAGVLNTFATRIPVSGGELLGLWLPSAPQGCWFLGPAGPGTFTTDASKPDPAVASTVVIDGANEAELNLSAMLEPDADNDDYGDETQDACLGDPRHTDCDPPETTITKYPPNRLDRSKAKFRFKADDVGAMFECKVDRKRYKPCTSPKVVKRLDDGRHKFKVRAIDATGNVDPTPAKDRFRVVD